MGRWAKVPEGPWFPNQLVHDVHFTLCAGGFHQSRTAGSSAVCGADSQPPLPGRPQPTAFNQQPWPPARSAPHPQRPAADPMFCPHPCRHEIIGTELHGCRSFICRPSVHNGNTTAARGLRRSSYLGPNPTAFHRVRQPPLSRSNHPHTATSHGGNIGLRWLRAPHPLLPPHKGSLSFEWPIWPRLPSGSALAQSNRVSLLGGYPEFLWTPLHSPTFSLPTGQWLDFHQLADHHASRTAPFPRFSAT